MTFEGKAKLFYSEASYIELITLYAHPKNGKHLRSLSRSQQIRPRKQILGKQIRPNFFAFDRCTLQILPTNLGMCKPTFFYFLYVTSEVKQYYLSYRPRTECSISHFLKTNCTQWMFRTINRGLLAKPFKKFPKSAVRPAGCHFYCASCQCGVECLP